MLNLTVFFFVFGSIAGWVLEIVFKTISGEDKARAGMATGPFCMLYGIGTYFLATFLSRYTDNVLITFILSLTVLTALEYITGVMLEKVFDTELWDYRKLRFGINKHISVEFMLIWGVLGVLFINFILPLLNMLYNNLYSPVFLFIIHGIFIYIILDYMVASIRLLRKRYA